MSVTKQQQPTDIKIRGGDKASGTDQILGIG